MFSMRLQGKLAVGVIIAALVLLSSSESVRAEEDGLPDSQFLVAGLSYKLVGRLAASFCWQFYDSKHIVT